MTSTRRSTARWASTRARLGLTRAARKPARGAQSRGSATTLPRGHGLVFTTRDRPVATRRGWSSGPMQHGVSSVRSGRRHTLGLVFHEAG